MHDTERGTGRTTEQIRGAPKGAIYVWLTSDASYPKGIARDLNRTDLMFIGRNDLIYRVQGNSVPVVVDHAVVLNPRERDFLRAHNGRFG